MYVFTGNVVLSLDFNGLEDGWSGFVAGYARGVSGFFLCRVRHERVLDLLGPSYLACVGMSVRLKLPSPTRL